MADDVLDVAMAIGLLEGVGVDIEDPALEGELGGDYGGAAVDLVPTGVVARLDLAGAGFWVFFEVAAMGSKVSSCIGAVDGASNRLHVPIEDRVGPRDGAGWARRFGFQVEDF